jgi:hypothetical protein
MDEAGLAEYLKAIVPAGETWIARASGVVKKLGGLSWSNVLVVVTDQRLLVVRDKDRDVLFDAALDEQLVVRPRQSSSAQTARRFVKFSSPQRHLSVGFPVVEVAYRKAVLNDAAAELLDRLSAHIDR